MVDTTSRSTIHGYPRQGARRELKRAVEAYWAGELSAEALLKSTAELRARRLTDVREAGIDEAPSNDFSLYDHVLDTAWMLGAVPARHIAAVPDITSSEARLDRYFAMARGTADVAPLEMTKWFDTNYHYLVPELGPDATFALDASKPLTEFSEARDMGIVTRPVLLGPVSFLLLSKSSVPGFAPLSLLEAVLPLYQQLLKELRAAGAEWVQLDEPSLVLDQPSAVLEQVEVAYRILASGATRPKILVASYFERLGAALPVLAASPVDGLALDFTRGGAANLTDLAAIGGIPGKRLVAGVIDGRNIWAADLQATLTTLATLLGLAARVDVAASCSLLHVPLDVTLERRIDSQMESWLSFAKQKLDEIVILTRGLTSGRDSIIGELQVNATRHAARRASPITRIPAIRERAAAVTAHDLRRATSYTDRQSVQQERLQLPVIPTTTIGSFPQTSKLRQLRARAGRGELTQDAYNTALREEIASVIALQERLGLDVLVHGEPERNDMVQYFAEQLIGYIATEHGWVQSYGTRYVRPPILAGDIHRPEPMTVEWARYAQSLTARPLKGMLTGPVTMLAWSFVRDDQPLAETARQVALALRDEVADLESAGISVVQVDEPALRETLPLRQENRASYLSWAVDAFRLATSGAADTTQLHTHMCYAEFGDVLQAIIDMDADVISLEAARSTTSIAEELGRVGYPNEVGPGVWDIHSPRVPSVSEIADRLRAAVAAIPAERLWANPDCGLKTRGYTEVEASLANLVAGTEQVRAALTSKGS